MQPLRTEGKGFKEFWERKSFKLSQLNFAAGPGLKYEMYSFRNLRLDAVHRFLSTDYPDDVSTTYIDPNLLPQYLPANLASFAKQHYSRKQELNPNDEIYAGTQRGDPGDKDAFFTLQLKPGVIIRVTKEVKN